MPPPGIGLVSVSEAAYAALGSSPRFYFDWERTRAGQAKLDSAFTPAVSLVRCLDAAGGLPRPRPPRRARPAARGGARGRVRPPRPPRPRLPRRREGDGARALLA